MNAQLPLVSPTPGDHLENLLLVGAGLFLFILALAVCDLLFTGVLKILKAASTLLFKVARRAERERPDPFERYAARLRRPPQPAVEESHHRQRVVPAARKKSTGEPYKRPTSAQEAIRRSCRR
ncbi:MAG: hypothetical protein M3430_02410 [Acidobacteriota bacterium]|nr:hypothetical protein [Acidobacteriota bacterium]